MTCRILIPDFERRDLFQAADPEIIARTSRAWEKDIRDFGPWTRTRSDRFGDSDSVWQPLKTADGPAVIVCGQCTSTMDAAWHFIENRQMADWDSVVAVRQTAGRGRQKRAWISPAGNIHASWRWPLPESIVGSRIDGAESNWDALLPLIAGFVAARVFKDFNVPVQIKWPNDLLINSQTSGRQATGAQASDGDQKFGGILVERRKDSVVVGIGINLADAPENRQLRSEFAVPATHLSAQGIDLSPLAAWTALVENGKSLFEALIQTATPDEFIRIIDSQLAWIGRKVQIRQPNADVVDAVILGMNSDGGLRIKKGRLEEVIYSGSIISA